MTLTLLDIYNKVTAQPMSIFETGISAQDEADSKVLTSIQKSLRTLWDAYPFSFRLRNITFETEPGEAKYEQPAGIIINKGVKIVDNTKTLDLIPDTQNLTAATAQPEVFYIKYNKLHLYPVPDKKYIVSVDYNTACLAKTSDNISKYNLSEWDDIFDIPEMYEDLFLTALMNKTMLNALGSVSQSHYQSYIQQFIESYKNLIANSHGTERSTRIKW